MYSKQAWSFFLEFSWFQKSHIDIDVYVRTTEI